MSAFKCALRTYIHIYEYTHTHTHTHTHTTNETSFLPTKNKDLTFEWHCRVWENIGNSICAACGAEDVVNIVHFMFVCMVYERLRKKYIPLFYCSFPSTINLSMLIRKIQTSRRLSKNVAIYINSALLLRRNLNILTS